MAELKTKKTEASVESFLNGLKDRGQAEDSLKLIALMQKASKCEPKMWGTAIIGFGDYRYKYASGREGDWFQIGFSPRKANITLYFISGFAENTGLLEKLGKYKTGGGCVYIKRLADVDLKVLEKMFAAVCKQMKNG